MTAKDLVDALEVNGERMDNEQRDYLGAGNDGDGDDDKMDVDDEMNWVDERDEGDEMGEDDETDGDDEHYVHLECDPFLDKLPPSLQLLRIDRADRAILKELTTIPTAIRNSLPRLEKLELQSHNQRLLKAAVDAVQYSGIVVELAGCRNDCWNAMPQVGDGCAILVAHEVDTKHFMDQRPQISSLRLLYQYQVLPGLKAKKMTRLNLGHAQTVDSRDARWDSRSKRKDAVQNGIRVNRS